MKETIISKKEIQAISAIKNICKECGRIRKIPPEYCFSCKKEMKEAFIK